jgi:hypothetical protein
MLLANSKMRIWAASAGEKNRASNHILGQVPSILGLGGRFRQQHRSMASPQDSTFGPTAMEIGDPVTHGIPAAQHEGIAAGTAGQHVSAGIADQDVVARSAFQQVAAATAELLALKDAPDDVLFNQVEATS